MGCWRGRGGCRFCAGIVSRFAGGMLSGVLVRRQASVIVVGVGRLSVGYGLLMWRGSFVCCFSTRSGDGSFREDTQKNREDKSCCCWWYIVMLEKYRRERVVGGTVHLESIVESHISSLISTLTSQECLRPSFSSASAAGSSALSICNAWLRIATATVPCAALVQIKTPTHATCTAPSAKRHQTPALISECCHSKLVTTSCEGCR